MTSDQRSRLAEILLTADRLSGEERRDFLERSWETNPDLREELEPHRLAARELSASSLQENAVAKREDPTRDDFPVLSGQSIGHFEIIDRIDAGAMGEVFRARDVKLDCIRALKFPRHDALDSPQRKQDLINEARSAAALSHPNICTIHEVDEIDDQVFIAMELVDGKTLREMIADGPLDLDQAVEIAIKTAAGLQAAHEKGIVHRDIKPGNIMVTPRGGVKIMDFGLAAHFGGADESQESRIVGTPAYMSPEQARGQQVDPRIDIWSLGVVLYEILEGRQPFQGSHGMAVLYQIWNEEPLPFERGVTKSNAELRALIERCLAKDPDERYPDAAALLEDLESLRQSSRRGWFDRLCAFCRPLTRPFMRLPRWLRVTGSTLLIALLAISFGDEMVSCIISPSVPEQKQLAVLGFDCIGGDHSDQAFCDGMLPYLVHELTEFQQDQPSLWVIPARDVIDNGITNTRDAYHILGANLVVTGSLMRRDQDVILIINLINAEDTSRMLFSSRIRKPLAELSLLQIDVFSALVEMLELLFDQAQLGELRAERIRQSSAFKDYIEGLGYLSKLDSLPHQERMLRIDYSLHSFGEAITSDPNFAEAHAGQGEAYWRKYDTGGDDRWIDMALASCQSALGIDSALTVGHAALGLINQGRGEYERAQAEFETILDRDSTSTLAWRGLAEAYYSQNKLDRAEAAFASAIATQPRDWVTRWKLGIFYHRTGRLDDAIDIFAGIVESNPDFYRAYSNLGGCYLFKGRFEDARAQLERSLAIKPSYLAYSNLGIYYYYQDDYERAAAMADSAVRLNAQDYRAWGNLASMLRKIPDRYEDDQAAYRKAAEVAEERRQVNPRDVDLLVFLAAYYTELDERERADAALKDALAVEPLSVETLFQAGHTYERLENRDAALQWLGEALRRGCPVERIENAPALRDLIVDQRWQELKAAHE